MILRETTIEFNGDIGTRVYVTTDGVGVIEWGNLKEKQEINTKVEKENAPTSYPVRFVFRNPKSIDVQIEALKSIKEHMQLKEENEVTGEVNPLDTEADVKQECPINMG
jgi:hypothetical protein